MSPKISFNPLSKSSTTNSGEELTFTLSDVNLSYANALRRTIISDIPTVVFKTAPYEQNKCTILTNTTRLNNEILKQRLSCIPIHITDLEIPLKNYLLEVDVENVTDTIMFVTTENFRIKNILKGDYLSEKDTREIFPPSDQTGYFIDFVRLRPRISKDLPGEKIQLTCEFSVATCKEDGMFNVCTTCSYGFTVDDVKMEEELGKKKQEWKDKDVDVEFEAKNWRLLDGMRITKKDSFDFILQTIGVFSNEDLVIKACDILMGKLTGFKTLAETSELEIVSSPTVMENCYDIILKNEDYTIGKMLEFAFYSKYFQELGTVTFCGFKKTHPHDDFSMIRLAYKDIVDKSNIVQNLSVCIDESIRVYEKIKKEFIK